MKTHRDLPDIPTDPVERRRQIKWLLGHKIWTYPRTINVPPEGYDPGNATLEEVLQQEKNWPEKVIADGDWGECIRIDAGYFNPETDEIDDNDELNTDFWVRLEAGPWADISKDCGFPEPEEGWNDDNRWMQSHDINLDCAAGDLETALLELTRLVRFFYGEEKVYREGAPERCEGTFDSDDKYIHGHQDAGDGFCSVCGFEI